MADPDTASSEHEDTAFERTERVISSNEEVERGDSSREEIERANSAHDEVERENSSRRRTNRASSGRVETGRDNSALEESAREHLGVEHWDRPLIFRETAEAATDTRLPYWSMLALSGAIATLGLALNNAAVVIGAMLIAPLLAPTMGLALALAMGDARLASQSGIAVLVSTALVIAVAVLLTVFLPIQTFTPEITARTRPTTLDLGIAVFSGLAGAVVSVTRRQSLTAAIPGVAVAVALIPPLAVAGFSAGAGFRLSYIQGSMLLYGANLAGIVFSGTLVFLLIGMHRPNVIAAAHRWHAEAEPTRLAAWAAQTRWFPRVGPIRAPAARIGLVLALIATLAVPLSITLAEIVRETRVQRAVHRASEIFEVDGRSSILSLQPEIGRTESSAFLRVATTEWFGDRERESFERMASQYAGERVRLVLEQLPTTSGDLQQLARLFPAASAAETRRASADLNTLLAPAQERIDQAVAGLALPDGAEIAGSEMLVGHPAMRRLTVGYTSDRPFGGDVTSILNRQIRSGLAASQLEVDWIRVPIDTLVLTGTPADTTDLGAAAEVAGRFERLHLAVLADSLLADAGADSTIARLVRLGFERERIDRRDAGDGRLRVVPYVPELDVPELDVPAMQYNPTSDQPEGDQRVNANRR